MVLQQLHHRRSPMLLVGARHNRSEAAPLRSDSASRRRSSMLFRFRSSVSRRIASPGHPLLGTTRPDYWTYFSQHHARRYGRQQSLLHAAGPAESREGAHEGESGYPRDAGQRRKKEVARAGGPQVLGV